MATKARKQQRRQRRHSRRRALRHPSEFQFQASESAGLELEAAEEGGEGGRIRGFTMLAYSGGKLNVSGFFFSHDVVVDLSGLAVSAKSRPILRDHDPGQIVGHTTDITATNSTLRVAGKISAANEHAREITESADNGFPWQASIGARIEKSSFVDDGEKVQVNGRTFVGPVIVARKTRLKEVSFVPLGADDNTNAKIAATAAGQMEVENMEFNEWLEAQGFDPEELDDKQKASLNTLFAAEQAAGETTGENVEASQTATATAEETGDELTEAELQAAAAQERIAAVNKLCGTDHPEIAAQAIKGRWDPTKVELEILKASRPKSPAAHVPDSAPNAGVLEASLCISANVPEDQLGRDFDEKTLNAAMSNKHRGAGLHELLYATIQAAGMYARAGRMDNETIRTAFEADQQLRAHADRSLHAAGGGFSTIGLSGILSNVANKTMLAAYESVETARQFIAGTADHSDFKTHTKYRMTGSGQYLEVGATGELKHVELSEEPYTNVLKTEGAIIALNRQMMINDDMGAFLGIPRVLGRMASIAVEKQLFTLLLSNPGGFFASGNNNYQEGAATNLQISSLTTGEQILRDQVDSNGDPILVSPAVLLVPTSIAVTAQQLMTETRVNETTTTDKPKPANNPHAGKWQPIASPYLNAQGLTGSSAVGWYLFANPADLAVIEIAYLNGRRVPFIESADTDFNTLGMQWRSYHDFGIAMQDKRAGMFSKGEA